LSWQDFELPGTRVFIFVLAVLLVWFVVFNDYNFFFDQYHWADRLLLLLFGGLVWWHPLFLFPLLVEYFLFVSQYDFLFGYSDFRAQLILNVLFLFLALALVRCFRKVRKSLFPSLLRVVVAAHYFDAGAKKIFISPDFVNWALEFELSGMFAWAHFKGWLAYLPPARTQGIFTFLETFNRPLVLSSLVLELGALLLLLSRRFALALLFLFNLFHLGLFVVTGTMFWQWVLAQGAMFFYVFAWPEPTVQRVFSESRFLLGTLILCAGVFVPLFHTTSAGWWHTGYLNAFSFVAEDESGQFHRLSPETFGPYRYFFHYRGPEFLLNEPVLPVRTPDYHLARTIRDRLRSRRHYEELTATLGRNPRDPKLVESFDDFVGQYFSNARNGRGWTRYLQVLRPFHHLSMTYDPRSTTVFEIERRLRRIHVLYRDGYYESGRIHSLGQRRIHTVDLYSGSNSSMSTSEKR
jgi:hypothetical protein